MLRYRILQTAGKRTLCMEAISVRNRRKVERPRIISWELDEHDWKLIFGLEWLNFGHWHLLQTLRDAPDGFLPESVFKGEIININLKLSRSNLPYSLRYEWAHYRRRRPNNNDLRVRMCKLNRAARL